MGKVVMAAVVRVVRVVVVDRVVGVGRVMVVV